MNLPLDGEYTIACFLYFPVGELMEALQMDPTEFKEQYNQKMPSKSDPVVFSCLAGTRSKQALGFAMSLGFSRYDFVHKDGINAASPHEAEHVFTLCARVKIYMWNMNKTIGV